MRLPGGLARALVVLGCAFSCATPPADRVASAALPSSDGRFYRLPAPDGSSRFTVLLFVSRHCEVVAAHEARLNALARELGGRGVRFFGVDSEIGVQASDHRDTSRRLGFPVLVDRGARLAASTGARYSGYAVVVDRDGRFRYRGGIDSDRARLSDDATPYLRSALDDLVLGRPVRRPEAPAFGCALRTW